MAVGAVAYVVTFLIWRPIFELYTRQMGLKRFFIFPPSPRLLWYETRDSYMIMDQRSQTKVIATFLINYGIYMNFLFNTKVMFSMLNKCSYRSPSNFVKYWACSISYRILKTWFTFYLFIFLTFVFGVQLSTYHPQIDFWF